MFRRLGLAGLVLAATSYSPALAQDRYTRAGSPFDGLYIGGQVGSDDVISNVGSLSTAGPTAGESSVEKGQTDKSAITYGAFAGYGRVLSNFLYLGGEVDFSRSNHHFYSFIATGNGFTQDFRKHDSVGLSVRAGAVVGTSLLYLKAGAVQSEFQYQCCLPAVFVPVDQSQRVWGARFGGGIETILGGGLAFRADYSFTSYDTANFSDLTTIRRQIAYDTHDSILNFGLAYRFGSQDAPAAPAKFAGFYGGVFGAYSNFASGPLAQDEGEASASAYGGGIGLLAGYRLQFNRLVAGVEADATFHRVRYSDVAFGQFHDLHSTVGFTGQLGYVFGNSLIFAKAGPVWGRFETSINDGALSAQANDTHFGVQYGGGVETALTGALSVRLDWTRSDFESVTIMRSDGVPLTMEPSVSTSRASLIYRY